MIGILDKIVHQKRQEVINLKLKTSLQKLKSDLRLNRPPISMESAIMQGSGVIAEFKRASPSKGLINENANIDEVVKSYQVAGASAISVLTDTDFFQAREDDLSSTRNVVSIPILRKDFIIDEYQIYQSKIMGADCILLIAAILNKDELKLLLNMANDLGLGSIIEVHNLEELDKLSGHEKITGVNNRNLNTFEVDIETSLKLAKSLGEVIKVTESGLSSESNLESLINAGYKGFLVGGSFMSDINPGEACASFVQQLKH